MRIVIAGDAGGTWALRRNHDRWSLWAGADDRQVDTRVAITDDTAWRLLFNALPADRVQSAIDADGDPALACPLLSARSVIV